MEETFASLVAEVETVVQPLGFKIERADFLDKSPLIGGVTKADNGELRITIVRKGTVG